MLEGKQEEGLSCAHDGFYESRREWMGRRHTILAFERYYSQSLTLQLDGSVINSLGQLISCFIYY